VCLVSFRLGHADGVSVETAKWMGAFGDLGFRTRTLAGAGQADRVVPGLAIGADAPPTVAELQAALDGADLVVVENVCSLPLNRPAADALADALRGRPAILHHHDLPWQRQASGDGQAVPPTDPAWVHVTVNWLSRAQLAERGIPAVAVPNCFDADMAAGDRATTRRALGVGDDERLLLQPTRAIARKNVPAALRLAAQLGAVYWLLGPAEDGYDGELSRLLSTAAPVRVVRGLPPQATVADAYAAADAVTLPSTWEGFGNPTVESALYRRPLAVGRYPVAREIAAHGFRWYPVDDPTPLARWLEAPDSTVLDLNRAIARRHFSLATLRRRLHRVLADAGWAPDAARAGG
jgi:glycosyltransferase involved in cell wall biosynthesis